MNKLFSIAKIITFIIAVFLSVFQVYQGVTSAIGITAFRPIHLTWVIVLIFMIKPLYHGDKNHFKLAGAGLDLGLIIATVVSGYFIASFDYDDFTYMMEGLKRQLLFGYCL